MNFSDEALPASTGQRGDHLAIDRAKLAKSAQKHLEKGNLDRAIADYEKLAESDPTDLRTLLKLGDVYTKQGSLRSAAETYRKVAAQYAEQGFFLKAVAVFKQILKLDPAQTDLIVKLGEMYELLSLTSDAIAAYDQAAEAFVRAGKQYKALVPLSKIEKLDPNNVSACIRYAEALSTARRTDEAIEAFNRGAVLLKEQGRTDDYVKVAERLLYHQPANLKLSRELAELYLDRDEPKHALAKLQPCFKAGPTDTDVLGALARAFAALGQFDKVTSVYREIGRIHGEAGRLSDQAEAMRAILAYDPNNEEAKRLLVQVEDSVVSASPVHSSDVVEIDDDEDLVIIDESDEIEVFPSAEDEHLPEQIEAVELDDADDVGVNSKVRDLMAEYEIFARYGLEEKVEAQLKAVLELMPDHLEARIKLAEHYASNERGLEAAEQLVAAAEGVLEQGIDPSLAVEYCTFAVQYDSDNVRAAELLHELKAKSGRSASVADVEIDLTDDEDDEFVFIDDDEPAEGEISSDAEFDGASAISKSAPWLRGTEATKDESGVSSLDDARAGRQETPTVDTWVAEHEAIVQEFSFSQAATAPPPQSERDVPTAEFEQPARDFQVTAPPPVGALSADLIETLEEFDFYSSQGMSDEAFEVLADALEHYPDHPELLARVKRAKPSEEDTAAVEENTDDGETQESQPLADITQSEVAASSPPVAFESTPAPVEEHQSVAEDREELVAAAEADDTSATQQEHEDEPPTSTAQKLPSESVAVVNDDMSFALAEKLAMDRISSVPPAAEQGAVSLGDVLEQFRAGVRKSVERSDSATHYDLGIAYMEMGLHAEAIDEFTVCLEDPARKCQALTMIGLSHVAKGDMEQGIVYFQQALAIQSGQREQLDLWFEIANAYELLGRDDEALTFYRRVAEVDSQYRQVDVRIERLGKPKSPKEEEEDFDTMFDNLILKE